MTYSYKRRIQLSWLLFSMILMFFFLASDLFQLRVLFIVIWIIVTILNCKYLRKIKTLKEEMIILLERYKDGERIQVQIPLKNFFS